MSPGGDHAFVASGDNNTADGSRAVVLGGALSEAAAAYSLAFGPSAIVSSGHTGAMLFADYDASAWYDFDSAAAREFAVRARGGVRFVTALSSGNPSAGVIVAAGGSSWSSLSDSSAKENITQVDGEEVLAKIALMTIPEWNYKTQDDHIRHLGPMAQEFYSAFGLGEDNKHINTIDIDGINMLAIQALATRTQELAAKTNKITEHEQQIETLQAQVNNLNILMESILAIYELASEK